MIDMDVSIVVPLRCESEDRRAIWKWNKSRWESLFPNVELIEADSDDVIFSRSASRNQGVAKASGKVVILADADTVPVREYILSGLDAISHGAPWVLPYAEGRYYNFNKETTSSILSFHPDVDVMEPKVWDHKITSWSGIVLVDKKNYQKYDERFIGWGWEDNAFQIMMDKNIGKVVRIDGWVGHLFHKREDATFNTKEELANRKLFNKVYRASWRKNG